MVIYNNGLITLDYNPAVDILKVELPNVAQFGVLELSRSLDIVAENIKNYDIKNLLLDSSNVVVEDIQDDAYKSVVENFILTLTKSRLKKLARVNTAVIKHEERLARVTSDVSQKFNIPIAIKMFSDLPEANTWLLQN
ncbi:hypothetical protein [Adhaeribacter aquaticus]|uniref:hypothetical protein n=1 Tax=Adhaeribacter aquaticus TaxID=299567 RepID=UPI000407FC05|nr:hypothetical protein [Adhaeribacter aquaticus]